jgi:DNA-binding transcriptional LysR family regulator
MSSNESLKQMCAAGFGPAYLSIAACVLELETGRLSLLPLANNPVRRNWYVVRLAAQRVPHVAMAFETFLLEHGQEQIDAQLPANWAELVPSRRARRMTPAARA